MITTITITNEQSIVFVNRKERCTAFRKLRQHVSMDQKGMSHSPSFAFILRLCDLEE